MRPFDAAKAATAEIGLAVMATTLSLVVIFVPVSFMSSISGRFLYQFGITAAVAVMVSLLVSFTLTPMMSARLLHPNERRTRLFELTEPWFESLTQRYERLLTRFLGMRRVAQLVLVGSVALIVVLLGSLPRELMPLEDRGRIWIRSTAQEGASFEYMQGFMDDVAHAVARLVPEASILVTQVPGSGGAPGVQGAVNTGFVRVMLKARDERERTQQQIAEELRVLQQRFTGARLNITQEASVGERRGSVTGVQFVIQAPDIEALRVALPRFMEQARSSPAFRRVRSGGLNGGRAGRPAMPFDLKRLGVRGCCRRSGRGRP